MFDLVATYNDGMAIAVYGQAEIASKTDNLHRMGDNSPTQLTTDKCQT